MDFVERWDVGMECSNVFLPFLGNRQRGREQLGSQVDPLLPTRGSGSEAF